jgi:U32 family peptidase
VNDSPSTNVPAPILRPEILAPAGDWECVHAAVENGADAVYFGLERFNARMRAQNFTAADLPKLMEFLHRRGVRGYVTFNTLVFADELVEAEAYLRTIIASGVDAAIVQDVGICRLIRALSSDFPIHCSTQMTITSAAGIAFARELGAGLVVLARENSLKEIAAIQAAQVSPGPEPDEAGQSPTLDPGLPGQIHSRIERPISSRRGAILSRPGRDAARLRPYGEGTCVGATEHESALPGFETLDLRPSAPVLLEVFVHGALCVAYSGQCLTSEALGGRSANRGECAQACRMPYELLADGRLVDLGQRRYLLSPQDLASLDVLPDLIRLGVASFKIEGRLKNPEYVAAITRVYRQSVDRVMAESAVSAVAGLAEAGPTFDKAPAGRPGSATPATSSAPSGAGSVSGSKLQGPSAALSTEPRKAESTVLAALHQEHDYTMEMTFSRGLYSGWFRGTNNQELVHANFGTKRGVFLGEVTRVGFDRVAVRLVALLKPGDGVVFDAGRPEEKEEGGRVYQVEPTGDETVLRFGTGDLDFRRIRAGDRLWKTSDPALEKRIRQTFEGAQIRFCRPVWIEVHGRAGSHLTVSIDDRTGHANKIESAIPLEQARTQPLTADRLREQLGRLGGTPFRLGGFISRVEGDVVLPISELNRLRRTLVAELEQLCIQPRRWSLTETSALARLAGVFHTSVQPQTKVEGEAPAEPPFTGLDGSPGGSPSRRINRPPDLPASPIAPELIVVIRRPDQLEAAWRAGARTIYCEFEDPKRYREAVRRFRELQTEDEAVNQKSKTENPNFTIWVAPPRIFKPGEEWVLQQVLSSGADGYLVRNYDHLAFFRDRRRRGDYSLNVANPLAAGYFLQRYGLERVTASYDLNVAQLEALLRTAPPAWFEITIHQHMPMFHMEHCLFCAFLTSGKDYRDCGRPCDRHDLRLRDRVGAEFPVKADAGCRNTVYNNRAQTGAEYVSRFLALGARAFRVEFLNESPEELQRTVKSYQRLLHGEITGAELWREFKLINQLGVTRGQMEAAAPVIRRKG